MKVPVFWPVLGGSCGSRGGINDVLLEEALSGSKSRRVSTTSSVFWPAFKPLRTMSTTFGNTAATAHPREFNVQTSLGKIGQSKGHFSEGREWCIGYVVVESSFLGRPNSQARGPETLILKGFGSIWGKHLGCPKRRSDDHGSNTILHLNFLEINWPLSDH